MAKYLVKYFKKWSINTEESEIIICLFTQILRASICGVSRVSYEILHCALRPDKRIKLLCISVILMIVIHSYYDNISHILSCCFGSPIPSGYLTDIGIIDTRISALSHSLNQYN